MTDINSAISDPNRPLSIPPREWMASVQASLAEDTDLTDNVIKRITREKSDGKDHTPTDVEVIDMGIDQIIQGIRIVYEGLKQAERIDVSPQMREAINKIKDLMDTAVTPYMKDICDLSDKFEEDNE